MTKTDKLYGVSELAAEFNLTPQALRFYEEKGLLSPKRAGNVRVYDYRDHTRLMLILKFRRLGFSLDEVRDYLSRYRAGGSNPEQYADGLDKIRRRIATLELMRDEIAETIVELRGIEQDALDRMESAKGKSQPSAGERTREN
ncbi:MerR family transcriptional regulator [Segnochrobactraceae bacterium EtOH-i3]